MASPASDIDLQISTELQALLTKKSHMRLRLTDERMSGEKALDALAAGEVDIAVVSNYQPYRDGVATVMPLYPTILHIAHRNDIDATDTAAMLSGTDLYAGAAGSASRMIFERIASRLGLNKGDVNFVDGRYDANGDTDLTRFRNGVCGLPVSYARIARGYWNRVNSRRRHPGEPAFAAIRHSARHLWKCNATAGFDDGSG